MIHFVVVIAAFLFLGRVVLWILRAIVAAHTEARASADCDAGMRWARGAPECEARRWLPVAQAYGLIEAWRQAMAEKRKRAWKITGVATGTAIVVALAIWAPAALVAIGLWGILLGGVVWYHHIFKTPGR